MCSVPFVFPPRPSVLGLACVSLLLAGCVTTTETRTVGTFASGGPGQYGEPAEGAAKSATARTGADYKPGPNVKLRAAELQMNRGNPEDARRLYEEVLAANPGTVDAVIGLARLDQIGGRPSEAEAGFQKAIRMDSSSARSLDALGQFYVQQKRWNDAVAVLQRATSAAPGDKTYRFHYAIALAKAGQIEPSRPLLMETVGSAATHYNIGLVLHEQGDLEGAENEFIAAILENPRMQQAQQWLNDVRHERDRSQTGLGGSAVGMRGGTGPIVPVSAALVQAPAGNRVDSADYSADSWPQSRPSGGPNSFEAPPPRLTPGAAAGNPPAEFSPGPPAYQPDLPQAVGGAAEGAGN